MRRARGMTLVEVTLVMALSTLVIMGLITFYVSSQTIWMRGSTQALAQRDATLLVETISARVRGAAYADVQDSPDADHQALVLSNAAHEEIWRFWWDEGDARVHQGPALGADQGPVVASLVARFQLAPFVHGVEIRLLAVRSAEGELVQVTSAAALNNWVPTP